MISKYKAHEVEAFFQNILEATKEGDIRWNVAEGDERERDWIANTEEYTLTLYSDGSFALMNIHGITLAEAAEIAPTAHKLLAFLNSDSDRHEIHHLVAFLNQAMPNKNTLSEKRENS